MKRVNLRILTKMGTLVWVDCPLCCDTTFDSKHALIEHLTNVLENISCPLCKSKVTTLEGLLEHLSLYDCQSVQNGTVPNIVIYEQNVHNIVNQSDKQSEVKEPVISTTDTQYITDETYECQGNGSEVNKMYVELLSKQLSKPILQTQELKLVKEDGQSRYMIVTQDDNDLGEGSAIVTKQNTDGTISLTTLKDIKQESETLIAPESDSGHEEIYSCSACKVSFTSVFDHIQKFHNDQEVVLEDISSGVQSEINKPKDYDTLESDETPTSDKQTPRRVITDTGDIVEEPMVFKTDETNIKPDTIDAIIKHPKLVRDKQGRTYTRRVVQIDKVPKPETVTKDTPKTKNDKCDPYHKVVTRQLQMKTGLTVKMYMCMSCNITVSDLNEFEAHPCKQLNYPCPRCPAGYENSKSLCAHMKVHKERPDGSPDTPVQYECAVCSTVFPTNKSLKLHKRMHDPVKSRPIEPPVASTDGKDVTTLYRCNICEKMIPFDYRTIHENSHKSSNKLNCSICNKKFTSMEFMEMHMSIHNLDKVTVNKEDKSLPYKCLYCNRRFARPHEKVKHERIHTGEKPHSCEICGKSFRVSYCLTLHMRTHTGARPYQCPHCSKRFKAHSVYNHHLLTHSEVRAYKCPFCPKAFKTSVQLAGHKNSHTKPFSCQHCNRPFASLYAVRVHTETHNRQNNLKFACALCGASYARAFALNDHVKQVHKRDMDNADNIIVNNQDDSEEWMTKDNTTEPEEIQTLNNDLQDANSQEDSDEWMVKDNSAGPEEMQNLNKNLQETITDLEMTTNELIP